MTFQAPRGDRFVAIENEIRALDGVVGVVVFAGDDGLPQELQVFVDGNANADGIRTQIGRILATHGAAAGIRRIYVLQVASEPARASHVFELTDGDGEEAPPQSRKGRVALRTIMLEGGDQHMEARVALGRGVEDRSGIATASATSHNLQVSAAATVEALEELLESPGRFALIGAALVEALGRRIVSVVLLDSHRSRELVGACAVGEMPVHEAAVRATLDAVNRQI